MSIVRLFFLVALLISLFAFALHPSVVSAAGNMCPASNASCTEKNKGQICPQMCVVGGWFVSGVCVAQNDCKAATWGFMGAEGPVTQGAVAEGTLSPAFANATGMAIESPGLLSQIGTFMSNNPLVTGLAIGAGTQLLSSLFSGSGGSGDSGSGYNNNYCASGQYYYSANPNPNDPCAYYSPDATGGTTLPTEGATGQSIADLINALNSSTPTITIDLDDDDDSNNACSTLSSLITCGEGYKEQDQGPDENGCPQAPLCVPDDSGDDEPTGVACGGGYCKADEYCSEVMPGQCVPNGKVDCGLYACSAGYACGDEPDECVDPSEESVSDIISNQDYYDDATGPNTPDPSQTDLNQPQIPVPADGVHGDLRSFGGGVTIYGRSRSGGTEVSGFFGGSNRGGLCQSRPWATNFLSYIIPPSFFDNICSAAGFGSSSGGYTGVGDTVRTVTGPAGPASTPAATQTGVYPEANIYASPPSVNLGGRTTIFWTSHDVSSCEESSSDGNFSDSSTSGGASTVALSGPVTFYITCLGVDGKYIMDSVTVNIGI